MYICVTAIIKGWWSYVCFVILNFCYKFCSQEYKFTLFDGKINLRIFILAPTVPSKQQRNLEWKERAREYLICHVCRGGRQLLRSRTSLYWWQQDEKGLHIGADGWTDCLFVLWQIHSTCVTALDLSPRRSGEDETGRRDGEEEEEGNQGAPADNAVSLFITMHWNRHRPHVLLSHPRKPSLFLEEVDV